MGSSLRSVFSLLLGIAIMLMGSGLVGTLLALRAVEEGFSELAIGIVMASFFLGYILGSWLIPPMITRVGHIRTFATLAAFSGAAALLHGLWIDPAVWAVLRLINGISLLGTYMVIESWLNEQVVERRGQVFAIYMTVALLSLGAGQYLLLVYGPDQLQSFMLVAMLFVLALVPIALTPVTQPVPMKTQRLPLVELLRRAPSGTVGAGVAGLVTGSFWGMAAVFAREIGMGDAAVAFFLSAAIFTGALFQYPIGRASDRHDRRKALIVTAGLAGLAAFGMFWTIGATVWWTVAMGVSWGAFAFSLYALSVAQAYDRLKPSEALGATRGLLLMNGIGSTLGPVAAGTLMAFGGAGAYPIGVSVVLSLFILFLLLDLRRNRPVPESEMNPFVPVTRTSAVAAEIDPRTDADPHQPTALPPHKTQ